MAPPSEAHAAYASSKVLLQLLPYEHTSSYQAGSNLGPQAILDASHYVEYYDEELQKEVLFELGVATQEALDFSNSVDADAVNLIRENTLQHLRAGKFIMSFGAEHTVSLGLFQAMQTVYPNVSILQIDAHSDLRASYEGNIYSHASVMARIHDLKPQIAQIGIRAQCKEEAQLIQSSSNIRTVFGHQLAQLKQQIPAILEHLSDTVYITIDADGLDPSIVPGVGTPEPGGILYYDVLHLLKEICASKRVVGFDIVECAPIEGQINSEYLLAKLAYKVLGYCSLNPANFTT